MRHEIHCVWKGDMAFETDISGHRILLDAPGEDGQPGRGPSPKKLLLAALAGCTGMDIVAILKKMRESVSWFEMQVSGETSDENPKRYTTYSIIYRFLAKDNLGRENVIRAASLSMDKYCGVSASLSPGAPVGWSIEFV